jgi:hypothetical protein
VAVPGSPSINSRALYYPYAVPAPTLLSTGAQGTSNFPTSPASGGYTQPVPSTVFPPDIGSPGVALPAIVLSVGGGSAPDYSGLTLLVHAPDGSIVKRFANFTSNQPMLNVSTWTTNGSSALQCRWQLVDALS